jgi:hypothetical protein
MKPRMGRYTLFVMAMWAWGLAAPALAETGAETSALGARVVVKVDDRDRAAAAVQAAAEAAGGYFSEKSDRGLTLKVPTAKAEGLIALAEGQGRRVERSLRRDDLSEELLRKTAALKAKQQIQAQYLTLLAQADLSGTLAIEKELVQLGADIERLEGRLRYLQHRLSFAEVRVLFEFEERTAPAPTGVSSFAWLNSLNLSDLLEDF